MKTTLRIAFVLLSWVLLVTGAWAQPAPKDQSAQILNPNDGRTTLKLPLAISTGTVTSYTITGPLPTAAQGTLWVNGAQVTTVPRTVAVADANKIEFDPASTFFGTYYFRYTATGTGGTSTAATYGISVSDAACSVDNELNLFERADESWEGPTYPSISVGGTTMTVSNFTQSANAGGTTVLGVLDDLTMPGKALTWSADYTVESTTANNSSFTINFNRPVRNFSVTVGDLDVGSVSAASGWTDVLAVNGYSTATATTPILLTSANYALGPNGDNVYSGNNVFTATGENAATGDDLAGANLIITFTQPVQRVTFTYSNTTTTATNNNPAKQVLTFPAMSWCAEADVTTTITAQAATVPVGATGQFNVAFSNIGPNDQADGVVGRVQLPAGLNSTTQDVVASNGGVYDNTTGVVTYSGLTSLAAATAGNTSALNSVITFRMPTTAVSATSTISTTSNEGDNVRTNTGTASIATGTASPLAANDLATTPAGTAITFAATGNDSNTGTVSATTINLNPNLVAGQTATSFTVAGVGTFTTSGVAAGSVRFTPANNTYTGTVTIPYTITNATTGVVSNQANLTVHITPVLDLSTSITGPANNSTVAAGASLTYTVTATNGNAFAVSSVTETLQLPAGLANGGAPTFTVGGLPSTVPSYNNTTGLLTFTPAGGSTLAANSTTTYTVNFPSAPSAGTINATATISTVASNGQETNQANNVAVNTVNVTPSFDVTTSLVGLVNNFNVPLAGTVGNEVTYVVRTTNSASSASVAPNVVQSVTFNAVLSDVYASNNGVVTTTATSTTVTFPALTSLAVGQSVPNTISFLSPAAAYTVTATVTANGSSNTGDSNTLNNTTALAATVQAPNYTPTDVYTSIVSDKTLAAVGSPVTLTVTSGNNGPVTAVNVVTQVYLPAGLTGAGSGGAVEVTNGTYNSTTGVVTFNSLAAMNSAATNAVPYTIRFNAPATGPVLATAAITIDNTDLVAGNNTDEVKVDVAAQADVTTVLEGPVVVVVGQTASYSVVTANNGPTAAYGVVQTVQLPVGLSSVTFGGPTTGSYNSATGLATFTLANALQAGAREVNTLSFTVPANTITDPSGATTGSNRLSAVARVSTSTLESSYANNTSAVVATVTPSADVRVTINGPATATIGSPLTYTMTTTNAGLNTIATVTPTMQLPAGLDGVLVAGGSYAPTTGLVSFDAVTNLRPGGSVSNAVVLTMPNVSRLTPVAQAVVGSATLESDYSNNRADVTTTPAAASTTRADLTTNISITTGGTAPAPNTGMVLTVTFQNADVAGGVTATGVQPSVQLPAGLGTVTVTGAGLPAGTYNNTTGLVTFNNGTGQTFAPATTQTYTLGFSAPLNGTVTGISSIAATTSDSNPANNASAVAFTVTPSVDVTTSISGPTTYAAGGRVVYAVNTVNNGTSPAASTITQTVRVPDTATNLSYPAGGSQSAPSGGFITVTFPVILGQTAGSSGTVTNYVSFDAPTAATTYTVTAGVSMSGDANGANNAASVTATMNRAPIAYNVVSNVELQNYVASTAGPRLISPLDASDADNNTLTYTLTSLPDAGTGVLYLNSAGTTPAAIGVPYSATQIAGLYFDPLGSRTTAGQVPPASYVGNTFFTYTVTDNAPVAATSAPALYTIQIGRDLASTYSNATSRGGSASNYSNGDLVGYLFDTSSLRYTSAGGLYDATQANGTLFAGADNGVASATADAASLATLSGLGLTLNPSTGEIRVTNRSLLRGGSFPLTITTVDDNGGTNTQTVSLSIGFGPLPVTLVDFAAKAQRTDAQLSWTTAQEKNNDYFVVERSVDGLSFEPVGRVAGHGTSTVSHQYGYLDAEAGRLGRVVYYRLKQVDLDGTSALSDVRTVSFPATAATARPELTLFPNPASETLSVRLSGAADASLVRVYSAAGKLVLQNKLAGSLGTSLDVRALPAGSYLVQVQAANGQFLTSRFVKY